MGVFSIHHPSGRGLQEVTEKIHGMYAVYYSIHSFSALTIPVIHTNRSQGLHSTLWYFLIFTPTVREWFLIKVHLSGMFQTQFRTMANIESWFFSKE